MPVSAEGRVEFGVQLDYSCWLKSARSDEINRVGVTVIDKSTKLETKPAEN